VCWGLICQMRAIIFANWVRPLLACSLLTGMLLGVNWCFSEIALAIKQVVTPSVASANDLRATGGRYRAFPSVAMLNTASAAGGGNGAAGVAASAAAETAAVPVAKVAQGRLDPFAPLAEDPDAQGGALNNAGPAKGLFGAVEDPTQLVQYTGMVKSRKPGDGLAMLQVQDPLLGQTTLIRKAGQQVDVGSYFMTVKSITPERVSLVYKGHTRVLALRPIMDDAPAAGSPGTPATSGSGLPAAASSAQPTVSNQAPVSLPLLSPAGGR
jgi:hypothetical protein